MAVALAAMLDPDYALLPNFNTSLVTFEDLLKPLYNHTVLINTPDIIHSEYNAKILFWLYFGIKSHMTNVKTLHYDSKYVLHALILLAKHGSRKDTTLVS